MIKANELRIGNLVVGHKDRICRVTEIHGVESDSCNGFMAWPIDGGGITTTPHKPIPLNEQWLLDFGFEICNKGPEISATIGINPITYDYVLRLFNLENGWQYQNSFHKINYVHQLQNLYHALTGEELEIK